MYACMSAFATQSKLKLDLRQRSCSNKISQFKRKPGGHDPE